MTEHRIDISDNRIDPYSPFPLNEDKQRFGRHQGAAMTDSVQDRIYDVINSVQPTAKDADRSKSFKELSWDSLDMVEMVNELEEEFDISITEDEAEALQTLQQVYDLVEKKLAS